MCELSGLPPDAVYVAVRTGSTFNCNAWRGAVVRPWLWGLWWLWWQACAQEVYTQAKLGPEDVQVVELHDCFSCNELLTCVPCIVCNATLLLVFLAAGVC